MTARASDPDTLVASAKAYLGALNKIVMKRQRDIPAAAASRLLGHTLLPSLREAVGSRRAKLALRGRGWGVYQQETWVQ